MESFHSRVFSKGSNQQVELKLTEQVDMGKASSKLLSQRSSRPNYFSTQEELAAFVEAEIPGHFETVVEIGDKSIAIFGLIDKNQPESPIVDLKFTTDIDGSKKGFIDVTLQMCLNKNEQTLGFLSFREIENYLRDENHIPALVGNGASFFPLFEKIISSLKDCIVQSRGHRTGEAASPTISEDYRPVKPPLFDSSVVGSFVEQSIQDQNFILNKILSKYVRPFLFRDKGDIEVLFIDGTMVVVNYIGACAHCTKSLTTTMDYIQTVLRLELSEPNLLVVTDS